MERCGGCSGSWLLQLGMVPALLVCCHFADFPPHCCCCCCCCQKSRKLHHLTNNVYKATHAMLTIKAQHNTHSAQWLHCIPDKHSALLPGPIVAAVLTHKLFGAPAPQQQRQHLLPSPPLPQQPPSLQLLPPLQRRPHTGCARSRRWTHRAMGRRSSWDGCCACRRPPCLASLLVPSVQLHHLLIPNSRCCRSTRCSLRPCHISRQCCHICRRWPRTGCARSRRWTHRAREQRFNLDGCCACR